jgi:hypothetical protein
MTSLINIMMILHSRLCWSFLQQHFLKHFFPIDKMPLDLFLRAFLSLKSVINTIDNRFDHKKTNYEKSNRTIYFNLSYCNY